MSSEFLVKQTLIKIIENAKFDCERENYKWFKLNFLNDDRKSFAGDYDMRTHIIRVFVPKTSAKTNANLFVPLCMKCLTILTGVIAILQIIVMHFMKFFKSFCILHWI